MPKKFYAVTIVRAVFDGERRDIAPGAEIPEGLSAETLDELKQLGAVREEVVEAPPPVELKQLGAVREKVVEAPPPIELTGDGSGEALPEVAAGEALPEVAAGEQIAQATDGGPNPDYNPDASADTTPAAPADKPTRGKK